MYFNQAGLKEGAIKLLKVLGWVALSAVITKLAEVVTQWQPTTADWVVAQGVINAVLVGLVKWVSTKK